MKRETKGLKIVDAHEDPRNPGTVFARVEDADGNTQSVTVPDWADADAVKQEAARQAELAKKPMKKRKDLVE